MPPETTRSSVWLTAQKAAASQRAGRYLDVTTRHPGKMLPAIARQAITTYTDPGELVLDPMCGIGTTLVEAVHLGRDAAGVEFEPAWADLATGNVVLARDQGAAGTAEVITGDARRLEVLVDPAIRGLVSLVVTSPPYGASLHGQVKVRAGEGLEKSHARYSANPDNLAHLGTGGLLTGFTAVLAGCAHLLRPGGYVAITARPWRERGELVDLPAAVFTCGEKAGLVPFERNVALLAGVRGSTFVPRVSFFQLDQVRKARQRGTPQLAIAHEDLLVLRKPPA